MKPGAALGRHTPLRAVAALTPGPPLIRRTPLAAGPPLERGHPLKRHTRLAPRSPQRIADDTIRATLIARLRIERPRCEARMPHDCAGVSQDGHEPLTRARGGNPLDERQIVMCCRAGHDAIHANPALATALGLLIPSWQGQKRQEEG